MVKKESTYSISPDILLIAPSYHRRVGSGIVPPLGLAYLIGYLKKSGFHARVIDCSLSFGASDEGTLLEIEKWLKSEIKSVLPKHAIGIGPCSTSSILSISTISKVCKQLFPNIPIIFGGPLTLIPDLDWLFFDELNAYAVVRGDGEYGLSYILDRIKNHEKPECIKGVQTSKNESVKPFFINDLDRLPYPSWDHFDLESYKPSIRRRIENNSFIPVIGSRGCKFKCGFCLSGQIFRYRKNSLDYVKKQLVFFRKKYGVRSFIFYDDNLFSNPNEINEEVKGFSESIQKEIPDIIWQMELRPDLFLNIAGATLNYIYKKGCKQINIGIEKKSISQLDNISKSFDLDLFKQSCLNSKYSCPKMRLTGTFILGGPGENVESINKTINFSTELNLLFAHFYPLELYPETPIYKSLFGNDNKYWYKKILNSKSPLGEVLYENSYISGDQLMFFVHSAYSKFYNRKEWERLALFHLGEKQFEDVRAFSAIWQKDRFRIGSYKNGLYI